MFDMISLLSAGMRMRETGLLGALRILSANRQHWHRDVPVRRIWTWMWICAGCQTTIYLVKILSAPYSLCAASVSGGQERYLCQSKWKDRLQSEKCIAKNYYAFRYPLGKRHWLCQEIFPLSLLIYFAAPHYRIDKFYSISEYETTLVWESPGLFRCGCRGKMLSEQTNRIRFCRSGRIPLPYMFNLF